MNAEEIQQEIEKDPQAKSMYTSLMEGFFVKSLLKEEEGADPIPWNRATVQKEYRNCHSFTCQCTRPGLGSKGHGPYLYAYWKEKGKLCKRYIGLSVEEYKLKLSRRTLGKTIGCNWTYSQWDKYEFIKLVASCGNEAAAKYLTSLDVFGIHNKDKVVRKKPSIDWAYRKVRRIVHRDLDLKRKVYAEIERRLK